MYLSLTARERNSHVPEQLCDLASVRPEDLISWVTRQAYIEGSSRSALALSFLKDQVIEKVAGFAMDSPDNYKHAELFMKTSGMLPTAGSGAGSRSAAAIAPVSIFNMPMATSSSGSMAHSNSTANSRSSSMSISPGGLPDMDTEIIELSKIIQQDATDFPEPKQDRKKDDRDNDDSDSDDDDDDDEEDDNDSDDDSDDDGN